MEFIGRKNELRKLMNEVNKDLFSFSLIYGRRRVGKSELVKKLYSSTEHKCIYYECKQVSEESNVSSINSLLEEIFNLPKIGYSKIEETLDFIFSLAIKEKIILILDEYPYLRENVAGLDSILQSLIDKYRDTSKLSLIVLGSYVDVMKSMIQHHNPLYGRVDLTIELKPMDYLDSSKFYDSFSYEDKVRLYSVFGGIPYYNRLIDKNKTVKENIIDLIASPSSRLENEVNTYLNSEISKITNANEVFSALSKGYKKYSDILSQSHVSSGPTLVDVLEKLINMGVVEKINPINEENNKKKSSYRISDNLSSFYFRYIFRNLSSLNVMSPEAFYSKFIEKDFEEYYVPHKFESICKQYLIKKNKEGKIDPPFSKIGTYYYDDPITKTNGEFDLVTLDEFGYVFYEVKFKKNPLTDSSIKLEIEQVNKTNLNCYKYAFISRSNIEITPKEGVEIITLEDLFK